MRKKLIILFAFIVSLFLIPQIQAQEKLTLALARSTLSEAEENYTYAIPKQLGYFTRENLDVDIIQADGSTAAIQAVASGSADIGYASSINIAAAIDKGVPIKAIGGLTTLWPYYIGVPKGSDIKIIADLKGKRVGVISLASASYADLRANLKLVGLSEEDVTIIAVGAGVRAAAAIVAGEIDAIDNYSDSFTIMAQNGIDLDFLPRPEAMEKLFSVTIMTSDRVFHEKAAQLTRFIRAAYKGIIYTKLYPENALTLAFAEFPALAGSDNPAGAGARNTAQAMATALSYTLPRDDADPVNWGQWLNLPRERWQAVLDFAYETGSTSRHLSVDEIWDDSLMGEAYDFAISDIVEP